MRDRSEQILRIAGLTLAALVVLQLIHAAFQVNPLMGVKIPSVPVLETNSNSTAGSSQKLNPPAANLAVMAATNKIMTSASSNLAMVHKSGGTNSISTNVVTQAATNNNSMATTETPVVATMKTNTNSTASPASGKETQSTNSVAVQIEAETNLHSIHSTNMVVRMASTNNPLANTNSTAGGAVRISRGNLPPGMMAAGGMRMGGISMMPGMPGNAPKLPPDIQARVDQIVNGEIFAPVMHPMPMGLLGIAGETAFLRSGTGQTGLVKVGDSLGDLKLLKIGINRVLVEQDGKEQELTIFNGYGGDSLLSKPDEISK